MPYANSAAMSSACAHVRVCACRIHVSNAVRLHPDAAVWHCEYEQVPRVMRTGALILRSWDLESSSRACKVQTARLRGDADFRREHARARKLGTRRAQAKAAAVRAPVGGLTAAAGARKPEDSADARMREGERRARDERAPARA